VCGHAATSTAGLVYNESKERRGMSKRVFTNRVLLYEAIGFALVIALVWSDEFLDLPHNLLGAPPRPPEVREGLLESCAILALAFGTLYWTRRALVAIRYLEGFLSVCSFCKRIRTENRWVPIEVYISQHSEAMFSHGLCPECRDKYYGVDGADSVTE
jgi:hypothetical protein